jgi:predicted nuclease of restriction endonuclease-like RecB superfamily
MLNFEIHMGFHPVSINDEQKFEKFRPLSSKLLVVYYNITLVQIQLFKNIIRFTIIL